MTGVTFRGLLATVLAAALAWSAHAANPVEDKPNSPLNVIDGAELVQALRGGGYVLYFRHGLTDLSTRDIDRGSLSNCATQRILSDAGRQQMTDIGRQFRRMQIPVGTVLASPYCRTIDTAKLAFGQVTAEPELAHTVTADVATTRRRAEVLSKLLATAPAPIVRARQGRRLRGLHHQAHRRDRTVAHGQTVARGGAAAGELKPGWPGLARSSSSARSTHKITGEISMLRSVTSRAPC